MEGEPSRKKIRKSDSYIAIRNKKLHGEAHLMHRKDIMIPAKVIGPNCQ